MIATRALALAGSHRPEDIAEGVACGLFQEWAGDGSVIITEILQTPLKKTLNFFLAEGNLVELRAMTLPILDWGRMQGCTHAAFTGRDGWERSFVRDFGFTKTAVVMEVRL